MLNSLKSGKLLFEKLGIDIDKVPIERISEYTAIQYYLTVEDNPSNSATNLEQIKRYLQSFVHLCDLKEWEMAKELLFVSLDTPTKQKLVHQMRTWSYYQEQIKMCTKILGNLSSELELEFLSILGNAHYCLGEYQTSISYHEQALKISLELSDSQKEGSILSNLGINYRSISQFKQALQCHEKALSIAQKAMDKEAEAQSLNNIGTIHFSLGNYQLAIDNYQRRLLINEELNNKIGEKNTANSNLKCNWF
jgi:tetratricopeptide (TPR) repeat protein